MAVEYTVEYTVGGRDEAPKADLCLPHMPASPIQDG